MTGVLKASEVLISDPVEASQIHNKGYYGVPQSGGSLRPVSYTHLTLPTILLV